MVLIIGIDVVYSDGKKVNAKVIPLSGHFDLPARAGILEQLTFTGHDSCCYSNEHGGVAKTSQRGHVMTFPFRNTPKGHESDSAVSCSSTLPLNDLII